MLIGACGGGGENNQPPNGTITAPTGNVAIAVGASATFMASCTDPDGDAITHAWSFGSGAPASTQQNPGSTVFATAGTYTVTYTCTDEKGLADPTPDTRTVTVAVPGPHSLSGTVSFDKVPSTIEGLDYAGTVARPIRGADVAVVDANNTATVLGTGVTSVDGEYAINWNGVVASVNLVVFARTAQPKIFVEDNTSGQAIWALSSPTVNADATPTVDLHAPSGFNGTSYTGRAAAPFAVLDAATEAVLHFQEVRPAAAFPDLHINWSPNNIPAGPLPSETQEEAYAGGRIGTSHWNGIALYILGKADVDTDEFDDHVIVHEWGHYFESKLARSDSPGGQHSSGEIKDARLAFSEGWGNGLSGIIWSPNTVYTDASGPRQAEGFGFDLEDNVTADSNPGWYSEASVQSILFDVFDDSGADEAFDEVSLGLGPIYDAMTGGLRTASAMTSLFSFIAALKSVSPDDAVAIDSLTRFRDVVGVPIADAYGTGETNNGGNPGNLPVYRILGVADPTDVTLLGDRDFSNVLGQNRFFRFAGDGASHTVSIATSPGTDVDVFVYRQGVLLAAAQSVSGTETTPAFTAASGSEYIIVVTGFGAAASYTTTVTIH
jgi:hypothetical protein